MIDVKTYYGDLLPHNKLMLNAVGTVIVSLIFILPAVKQFLLKATRTVIFNQADIF